MIYRRCAFLNWHNSLSLVCQLIFNLSNSPIIEARFPQLPDETAVAQDPVWSLSLLGLLDLCWYDSKNHSRWQHFCMRNFQLLT